MVFPKNYHRSDSFYNAGDLHRNIVGIPMLFFMNFEGLWNFLKFRWFPEVVCPHEFWYWHPQKKSTFFCIGPTVFRGTGIATKIKYSWKRKIFLSNACRDSIRLQIALKLEQSKHSRFEGEIEKMIAFWKSNLVIKSNKK